MVETGFLVSFDVFSESIRLALENSDKYYYYSDRTRSNFSKGLEYDKKSLNCRRYQGKIMEIMGRFCSARLELAV